MRFRFLPESAGLLLLIAWYFSSGLLQTAVGLSVVALVGGYLAYAHPRVIHATLAITLGLMPFGIAPGINISLVLLLTLWTWVATLLQWPPRLRGASLEFWVAALLVVSALSVLAVRVSNQDFPEFLKWLIATSLVFPLIRMDTKDLIRFGKLFSISVAAASVIGMLILTVDKAELSLKPFQLFGYDEAVIQFAYGSEGTTERLAGTFLNPNGGAVFLFIGLILCVALFRGRIREIVAVVILVGLALTLSRSAFGGLLITAIFMLTFHPMAVGRRTRTISALALTFLAAALTPVISTRIADSFGSSDFGTRARGDSFTDFPSTMDGRWLFGLGWGRIEFVDPVAAIMSNHVSNSPLLSIYRGGIIVGIVFTALLIHACIVSFRAVTDSAWTAATIGAGFIGFASVTLQLDFPVVTISPITAVFSLFLAFVGRLPSLAREHEPHG